MLRVVTPSAIRRASLAAALVLVGYGCASREAPAPPPEDPQLGYARAITGFGGFFLDKQGLPTVYLRDPGQRPAAEKALAQTLRSFGLAPADLRVLEGQYDYLQLHEWFDSVSGEVFSEPGVVFVDVDEGANRLHVGVESEENRAAVAGVLSRLGIPPEAAVIDVTRPFVPFIELQHTVRPPLGGLMIGRVGQGSCTLGFNVMLTQKGNTRDHRRSFITNSHCTNTPGGTEETQFGQHFEGLPIGTEVDDPVYHSRGSVWIPSPCPRGRKCRYSDSARVLYSSDVPSAEAGIARITEITADPPLDPGGTGESTINGTFRIAAERSQPVKGMTLHKVGALSGWTVGKVTKTCANIPVDIAGEKLFFFCQGVADGIAVSGDSGSPVFEVGAPPLRDERCFDHDCDFTIAVDASIQIDESHGDEVDQHETNNIEIGRCIG